MNELNHIVDLPWGRSFKLHPKKYDQFYYGRGKVLLSGEYFVLDGAKSLGLPTVYGQSMGISYGPSYNPVLTWKSYDHEGNIWFEAKFEFWHFNILDESPSKEAEFLRRILIEARNFNKHFLRDEVNVTVECYLDFPREWGLGSSSSLIYNIAQWAYISPFALSFAVHDGSGYDVACAGSEGPIVYEKRRSGPFWSPVNFYPLFADKLAFVYSNKKQDSAKAIHHYRLKRPFSPELYSNLTRLSEDMLKSKTLQEFAFLLTAHERLIADNLDLTPIKEQYFSDFSGEVKSLGAWGGDFLLVTCPMGRDDAKKYFAEKGFETFIPFEQLLITPEKREPHNDAPQIH